ncbi:tnf receptor associated factor (traf) [Anaeramoeba flamelloides]|uniref:Tnf receptor associated factor (Traf) n=1 Tax=Anaeramoeba flamelloides TaxID=1746091 RepID=A0AAV7ZM65_9EUKA|nr:tnf receptor associated factor (traf) [Anaeramoeba flamelloides]
MTQTTPKKSKRWNIFKKKKKPKDFDELINRLGGEEKVQTNENENQQRNENTNNTNTNKMNEKNKTEESTNVVKKNQTQQEPKNTITKQQNKTQTVQVEQDLAETNTQQEFFQTKKEEFVPIKVQQFEYVDEEISESMICKYCKNPFTDPSDLPCGHTFCTHCILNQLGNLEEGKCFLCSQPFPRNSITATDQIVHERSQNFKVYCTNKKNGCMETFPRFEYQEHKKVCQFEQIMCQNEGCQKIILKKDYEEHLLECEYRIVECPNQGCNQYLIAKKIKDHLKNCDFRMSTCNYCNQTITYTLLETHLENECMKIILHCPHSDFGCDFVGLRTDLNEHLKTCVYENINGLVEMNRRMLQIAEIQKEEIRKLQERYEKIVSSIDVDHLKKLKHDKLMQITRIIPEIFCKNCDQKYKPKLNSATSCKYHPGKWKVRNLRVWTCCGSTIESSQGCMTGYHIGTQ